MKCKDCEAAVKDFFKCAPGKHVCIGVKEPFVIDDVNVECTQYPEKRDFNISYSKETVIQEPEPVKPYVDDRGIYVPYELDPRYHRMLLSKELFVEAYNKWIKQDLVDTFVGVDNADDWCD